MSWIPIKNLPLSNYTYILLSVIVDKKEMTVLGFYSSTYLKKIETINWLGNITEWDIPTHYELMYWMPIPNKSEEAMEV